MVKLATGFFYFFNFKIHLFAMFNHWVFKFLLFTFCLAFTTCKKDKEIAVDDTKLNVGASANNLLSANIYNQLTIEIQYVANYKPTQNAVNNLVAFLNQRLNKPNGINIVYSEIISPNKLKYTLTDIKNLEDQNRKEFSADKNIATYFLFLDGEYAENTQNEKVLGIAYRNTSMVIFEKTIHSLSDDITEPNRDKLETTVINHEYGHILGLVNIGTNMQINHQDVANGSHCMDKNCLMYYTAETNAGIQNLLGSNPIPSLDANCINDLKANGGK